MRIPAYAKINLYLDVMERREDGFHNIKSIMHTVSLCDYVSAEMSDLGGNVINITCGSFEIPSGEGNLVWKAAKAFFDHFGITDYNVSFNIEKNIPVSAGLAGGSTDAAAALKLLNELYGTNASVYELCRIGALIGSDVPFCVVGGTCLALGRGEELEYLPSSLDLTFVIAKAGEGVSTPAAYKKIDEKYGESLSGDFGNLESALRAVKDGNGEMIVKNMYNTFESVVLDYHAEASKAKEIMLSAEGSIGAMLSGSGPSVFGIFTDENAADKVKNTLASLGYSTHVCKSI